MAQRPIIEVRGAEALQRAILQTLEAVSPFGTLGEAAKQATLFLARYAKNVTHVDTGMLQASHIVEFQSGHLVSFTGIPFRETAVGRVFINPVTRNPVHGEPPADYGIVEHDRGGPHAFYEITFRQGGPAALGLADRIIRGALPRGGASAVVRSGRHILQLLPRP